MCVTDLLTTGLNKIALVYENTPNVTHKHTCRQT